MDDSAFMRKLISDFFLENEKIEVVGTARNGKDALMKIPLLKPDVITLDVEMPELNGLDTLKEIMNTNPIPVVMLSSTTDNGTKNTLIAMEYGAVDFVTKPGGTLSLDLHKVKDDLVHRVELASQVPIEKLSRYDRLKKGLTLQREQSLLFNIEEKKPKLKESISHSPFKTLWNRQTEKLVLIGTSTGGPRALQEVITKLPENIPAPILIVQHMPSGFTKSLASRLDQLSSIQVKEAQQGDVIEKGTAYIAPGGYHLKIQKNGTQFEIVLDESEPPRSGHRPAVDVMFENVSQFEEFDKVAVIMTGMGADGSKGLIALKKTGNVIAIAESQETSIVYGMPKAAVETNLVDEIVDVDHIAETIMKYMS